MTVIVFLLLGRISLRRSEIQKSDVAVFTAIWPQKQKAKNHYFDESFSSGPSHGMATAFWAFVKDFRKKVHRDSSPFLSQKAYCSLRRKGPGGCFAAKIANYHRFFPGVSLLRFVPQVNNPTGSHI